MRRQRNMSQIKEQQNYRKRTKQNGDKNSIDAEFNTLIISILKKLSENINSIKKDQSAMKDALEMKNNLKGINCRIDELKNQNSDL